MKSFKIICYIAFLVIIIIVFIIYRIYSDIEPGSVIDSYNGVDVYYNGNFLANHGRNVVDGYNVGQKYQCVEYVKRYYLEVYGHKMPDSYGHAVSFYDKKLEDGGYNKQRALYQFSNPGSVKPKADDVVVMDGRYGHVALITAVYDDRVEIIQQNVGKVTRDFIKMSYNDGRWTLQDKKVLGWLSRNNK